MCTSTHKHIYGTLIYASMHGKSVLVCIYLYIIVSLYMHIHAYVECVYLCMHISVLTHADVYLHISTHRFITRTYLMQLPRLDKQVQCLWGRLSNREGLEPCANSVAWLKLPRGRGRLASPYPFLSFFRKSKLASKDSHRMEAGPWGIISMT